MSWVAAATIGASVVGGVIASNAQKDAANTAAGAQIESSQRGIDEQRRQFDNIQKLLAPYVSSGEMALSGQLDLLGLNGPEAEKIAIDRITSGEGSKERVAQGEYAFRQNGSGGGDLRGGIYFASRASSGPAIASRNTYGVATAPIVSTLAPTSPMITSENSPRAIRAVPARICPRRAAPSRRAA